MRFKSKVEFDVTRDDVSDIEEYMLEIDSPSVHHSIIDENSELRTLEELAYDNPTGRRVTLLHIRKTSKSIIVEFIGGTTTLIPNEILSEETRRWINDVIFASEQKDGPPLHNMHWPGFIDQPANGLWSWRPNSDEACGHEYHILMDPNTSSVWVTHNV